MLLKEAKEEHRKKYKYTKNPVKIQIGVILDIQKNMYKDVIKRYNKNGI